MSDQTPAQDARPLLRIVRGDATPEQLAALVAVLSAAGGAEPEPPRRPARHWASPERAIRSAPQPGRGAWRAASWPH